MTYMPNTHNKYEQLKQVHKCLYLRKQVCFYSSKRKKATVKLLAHLCTKPVNFTACYKAFSVKVQKN